MTLNKLLVFTTLLLSHFGFSQVTYNVFNSDFSTPNSSTWNNGVDVGIGSSVWKIANNGNCGGRLNTGYLEITTRRSSSAHGQGFAYIESSGANSQFNNTYYNSTLANNQGIVTWTFNMRRETSISTSSGFSCSSSANQNYVTTGLAFILASSESGGILSSTSNCNQNATADGYAVIFGGNTSGSSIRPQLVRFENGLHNGNRTVIANWGTAIPMANYMSIKVTYNPATNAWGLQARSDGTGSFANPNAGTYGTAVTGTDGTYTNQSLKYTGGYMQSGCIGNCDEATSGYIARFDNLNVAVTITTPNFQSTWMTSAIDQTWCAGETKTVSVNVKNTGLQTWTSGATGNNVNFSAWGSWQSGRDSNPRLSPFAGLATNGTQDVYFTLTAPTIPGTYTIHTDIVQDGSCWFADNNGTCGPGNSEFSYTINVIAPPTAPTFSNSSSLCGNTDAQFNASSGSNNIVYSIESGGATVNASSGLVSSITSSFTIRATATNACGSEFTDLVVTVNSLPTAPTISASGTTTLCDNATVELTSSEPNSIVWSNTASTASITVSQAGNYFVTYTDGNGCSVNSLPVAVTQNTSPSIPQINASGATTFCQGGTVDLSTTSTGNLLWSTNETSNTISVGQSGAYTVSATENGCTSTSLPINIVVTQGITAPTIAASGPITFCEGQSVTLTSSENSQIEWSTSETSAAITISQSGTYSVTQTIGGCSATSTPVQVIVNPNPAMPTISASGSTIFCQGGNVQLTSSASTGNLWSTNSQNQTITVTNSDNYFVTVTDANGCNATSNTISVTVNQSPDVPIITPNGPVAFCEGESITLFSSSPTGNLWSNNLISQAAPVYDSGTYTVTITDQNGCSSTSAGTVVTVNPLPNAVASLAGNGISINATPVGGATYKWINCTTNTIVAGQTNTNFAPTQNGSYAVIVTTQAGCADTSNCVSVSKLSIAELNNHDFTIYPNPAQDEINIQFNQSIQETYQLRLTDMNGRTISNFEVKNKIEKINTKNLERGVYIITIQNKLGMNVQKVVLN
jgi:hypothetical protein